MLWWFDVFEDGMSWTREEQKARFRLCLVAIPIFFRALGSDGSAPRSDHWRSVDARAHLRNTSFSRVALCRPRRRCAVLAEAIANSR